MMSDEQIWGLWGGREPGGWCSFKVAAEGDRLGYAYVGTLEEAQAGSEVFRQEQSAYIQERFIYTPQIFDCTREPESRKKIPTKAQWETLDYIRRHGSINGRALPSTWRKTLDVLARHGWYRNNFNQKGIEVRDCCMVLTTAGEKAWLDHHPTYAAGKPPATKPI
jgi:hypothetical protein